jgi:hypothetical protein
VRSANPGYCFKKAGWHVKGRSADGKKTLLQKAVRTAAKEALAALGEEEAVTQ